MNISKFIGCVLIVVGSSIGAGILALPMQISGAGFILSTIAILAAWTLMTTTGLLVVETNLALPNQSCSFSSMAEKTLGTPGKIVTWVSYLLLLYAIVAAYMAGESSLITHFLESTLSLSIPPWISALLFTFVLGFAVLWGTKTVDHFNRGLISLKGFLLVTTLVLTLPHIDINFLSTNQNIGRAKYLFAASPVFLHIFNYHFIIPSLRMYVGDRPSTLKWIIISGTIISLTVYMLWVISTLGTVPMTGDNGFSMLSKLNHPADTPDFIKIMAALINNKWVTASINGFYNVSMTTSFLGVSLGLFDFLADGFKRPDTRFGRLQTAITTFFPPLAFALFFPQGFIMALNYSASFIAILCIILPASMVYKLRKSIKYNSPYRMVIGNKLLTTIIVIGMVLFLLPILTNLHLLPSII